MPGRYDAPMQAQLISQGTRARVLLAVPYYERIEGPAVHSLDNAAGPDSGLDVKRVLSGNAFLALNFNALWCIALCARLKCPACGWQGSTADNRCFRCGGECEHGITHFAMHHSDVVTRTPAWLAVALDRMAQHGADLLSVHLPIKDERGLSSTALEDRTTGQVRRLTTGEIKFLEHDTFDAAMAGHPDCNLLASTGLWVCDFTQPWVQKVWFEVRDRIVPKPDGQWAPECCPEDWGFSRKLHRLGLRVMTTKAIVANHVGHAEYPSDAVWGLAQDEAGPALAWTDEPVPAATVPAVPKGESMDLTAIEAREQELRALERQQMERLRAAREEIQAAQDTLHRVSGAIFELDHWRQWAEMQARQQAASRVVTCDGTLEPGVWSTAEGGEPCVCNGTAN